MAIYRGYSNEAAKPGDMTYNMVRVMGEKEFGRDVAVSWRPNVGMGAHSIRMRGGVHGDLEVERLVTAKELEELVDARGFIRLTLELMDEELKADEQMEFEHLHTWRDYV